MKPSSNFNQNYLRKKEFQFLIEQNHRNTNLFIGCKNKNFFIEETTQFVSNAFGFKSPEQLYGLTDYEIPCPSAILAPHYIEQDKKVLQGNKLTILDFLPLCNETLLIITTRIPITNDKFEIIGSAFFARKISNNSSLRSLSKMMMHNAYKTGSSLILNEENIFLENDTPEILTKKEFVVLWLLARGFCPKKIAHFLSRSLRTVEDHITHIKIKYDCKSKTELIEKAINNGILNYLPINYLNGE